jgi:hypothetical protein
MNLKMRKCLIINDHFLRFMGRIAAQQKLVSKNNATNAPVMARPKTPARRSWLRITPSRLKMKPSGVATMTVSPPRAEMIEPQPGLHSHMVASAARGASEIYRPIRPRRALRSASGSAGITGGSSIFTPSKLHLDRLAGRWQRLEVELNVDGDFLADQVLGYSP